MVTFWNIFLRTFAIIVSVITTIILGALLLNFIDTKNKEEFLFITGDKNSPNTIAIVELNGLIIESNNEFSDLTNPFLISPLQIQKHLDYLKIISPKVIIFSINSPGGTVSASKNFYDIVKSFKKNNNTDIFFHTNEILTSGGYWASTSGDGIYASYGSIIGSIGVKGPDWFFYDQPKSISTGIFGNRIETIEGIKIFSSKAGKSKDIFNPFRKPKNYELDHLQNMVDEIYEDFVRVVSKERKIEKNTIINDVGALIYTSKKAIKLHLIDDEISLKNLINNIIKEKIFENYKIIKINNQKNSILRKILINNYFSGSDDIKNECLSLRSSISSILSYQSIGC